MDLLDLRIENARLRMDLIQAQSVILDSQFREQNGILADLMKQREATKAAAEKPVADPAPAAGGAAVKKAGARRPAPAAPAQ
ncbi:hypothetical protein [Sphingobium indicum]